MCNDYGFDTRGLDPLLPPDAQSYDLAKVSCWWASREGDGGASAVNVVPTKVLQLCSAHEASFKHRWVIYLCTPDWCNLLLVCRSRFIIIIIIYFENVYFFHAMLGLDVCPYEVPPHIPENCPLRPQTNHFHVIIHTFSPSLPIPLFTSHPCHLHLSTGRHPIIHAPTLQMPKLVLQW